MSKENFPEMTERNRYKEDAEEVEVSLKDLFGVLWKYRVFIVVSFTFVLMITLGVISYVFLFQPKEIISKLEFKIEFDGIEKNEYPNGLKFSTSDIVSNAILNQVYEKHALGKHMSFESFKRGLGIYQTNDALRMIEMEYADRLSAKNLTIEDRDRLETEYREKVGAAMVPIYTLSFTYNYKLSKIPQEIIYKVLYSIIETWAEYSKNVKGIDQYQIALVSKNILTKEMLMQNDYLIATDMLRLAIKRIEENIQVLEGIPGIHLVKVGENKITLRDIKFRLADLQQFQLSPVMGVIRQNGITRKIDETLGYLENQIFEMNLKEKEFISTKDVYDKALRLYLQRRHGDAFASKDEISPTERKERKMMLGDMPAMIPQFGESFLTSIVNMALENSDAEYRQNITEKSMETGLKRVEIEYEVEYYQNLYDRIKSVKNATANEKYSTIVERINQVHEDTYNTILQTIQDIENIYQKLNQNSLSPSTTMYSVTKPVVDSVLAAYSLKKLIVIVVVAIIFSVFLIFICALFVHAIRK